MNFLKKYIVLISLICITLILNAFNFISLNKNYNVNYNLEIEECKLIKVVDGDTIWVDLNGKNEKVRFVEIDTPESVHPDKNKNTKEGDIASEFLKSIIKEGQILYLTKDMTDRDKYDRLLRMVWVEIPENDSKEELKKKCLNAYLVKIGLAKVVKYNDYKYHNILKEIENGK